MKGKDLHTFVRFGGLDLKNQKGYSSDSNDQTGICFHAPPAARGFYAMPKAAQEYFLLGAMREYQPGKLPNYPDVDYKDPNFDKLEAEYEKRCKRAMSAMRKEFIKNSGCLWHHLDEYVKPNEVLDRHGSWVKTTIADWKKAFNKMSLDCRYGTGREELKVNSINSSRGIMGLFSKDHCEVFIDEKV